MPHPGCRGYATCLLVGWLQVGLFNSTPEQKLYPNPAAAAAVPDAYALYEFLGKMLGKAMYEVRTGVFLAWVPQPAGHARL